MELIKDISCKFDVNLKLNYNLIIRRKNKYFLINEKQSKIINKNYIYAGTYLGQKLKGNFIPSFGLLKMVLKKNPNKIFVNKKTEWLFICGRDIFNKGITKIIGSKKKGKYTLILNQQGECLGFGRIIKNLDEKQKRISIKNIKDIGDFLRRERYTV